MKGNVLAEVAEHLLPRWYAKIHWGDLWEKPISNGHAFEWTMLAALLAESQACGWECQVPLLDMPGGLDLFALRNEIPHQHAAQVGNSGVLNDQISLGQRFLQSLVPKAILQRDGKFISLFREGFPYHKVMASANYLDRPDIVFVEGRPTPGFPVLHDDVQQIEFSFDFASGLRVTGILRVISSPLVPCRARTPRGGVGVPVLGIVECTTHKQERVAVEQLSRYEHLFGSTVQAPRQVLVSGNPISLPAWNCALVDLSSDPAAIEQELIAASQLALGAFGLR